MYMDRIAIKLAAKEHIKGKLWDFWKPTLLVLGVYAVLVAILNALSASDNTQVVSFSSILSTVLSIAVIPAAFGLSAYYMKLTRGEPFSLDLLKQYYPQFIRVFLIYFLFGLLTVLWSLLFIIPGIIMSIAYSMAFYIAIDQPETEGLEPIRRSKEMMNGHKWEYFVFDLSFLGWELLAALTCGLLYIWVMPYKEVAKIMWYDKLKELTANKESTVVVPTETAGAE